MTLAALEPSSGGAAAPAHVDVEPVADARVPHLPFVAGSTGYPLPLPTPRAAWLVAGCALPIALGFAAPWLAFVGLGALLLILCAIVADWLTIPPPAAFIAARDDRPVLGLNVEERIGVTIACRADVRGSLSMRMRDDLTARLRRVREPAPIDVQTREYVRLVSVVVPLGRGRLGLGSVHARVWSGLGLAEREVRFDLGTEVRVYPGIGSIAGASRLLRRGVRSSAGDRRTRRRGEGTAFESLRDYVQGEDPRRIDWKATARRGKLISRHYEIERSQNVMLLIDCGRWMTGESDGMTRLDQALNSALLLAHVCALRDDRVGVLAFSDRIEAFVPPTKGKLAVERVVQAVFDLEPRLVESDYVQAFTYLANKHRKRSLLVIYTDLIGADPNRMLIQEVSRAARRHLPLIVTMRDTAVEAQTDAVPGNARAAYQQAAAEEILQERAHGLALLQAGGAHVLDTTPGELGIEAVNRYLDIKSRMLL